MQRLRTLVVIGATMFTALMWGQAQTWGASNTNNNNKDAQKQADARRLTELKAHAADLANTIKTLGDKVKKVQTDLTDAQKKADDARKQVNQARQDNDDATQRLAQAKQELTELDAKLLKDMENTDPTLSLKQQMSDANKAYLTRKEAVLTALKDKPDYQALTGKLDDARNNLSVLKASPGVDNKKVADAAQAVIDAENAVSKYEQDALAADPEAVQLQKSLEQARKALADQIEANKQAVLKDPKHVDAATALNNAQTKAKTTAQALQDANGKVAAAENQANRVKSELADIQARGQQLENQRNQINEEITRLSKKK